jgi:enoyl-CoA hydratase/carnithine racemase
VSLVTFAQDGDLGVVTLNSPPLNLVVLELARDGAAALEEAAAAPIRALLLRAEGEHFCAGADVRMFAGRTAETGAELVADFQPIVQGLERLPVPTLAAVHGLCLAAGLELALACRPTVAHRASKRLIRTALDEGIAGADAVLPDASAPVFASQDLQDGVASLLERGPGHARFEGR